MTGRRIEPEADVGEPKDRPHTRQRRLDQLNALDRLDAVAPTLLHSGRQWEGERVEEEVSRCDPVLRDGDVVDRLGRTQLPCSGPGLTLGVDARADDGRAVVSGQREE